MNPWEKGIWCLTIGLTGAVLVKLWLSGLVKIYKILFGYLAVDFLASAVGALIPYRSTEYAYYYFSAQTLKIAVAGLVVVEVYSLALERHPALAKFVRSIVGYMLGFAALIPAIALWVDRSSAADPQLYLHTFLRFERTMNATMAIFLILISMFMAWFPVRLRRNVVVYIGGFIAWSLSSSAYRYVTNHWLANPHIKLPADIIYQCITFGCLLFWLFGLRPEGEGRTAVVGHLWNRAEADRLTEQLDAINDSLTRLRRK